MPTQTPAVPATLDCSMHICSQHAYTHVHVSIYRCITVPYMLRTPGACTAHIHCPHRPVLCLPGCHARSQPAQCTYKHHMHTQMRMALPIDASPCQVLYAPLSPTSCTHVCASLSHTPLCPYRLLLCPPYSIGSCTHHHHMHIVIAMSLSIDASSYYLLKHP